MGEHQTLTCMDWLQQGGAWRMTSLKFPLCLDWRFLFICLFILFLQIRVSYCPERASDKNKKKMKNFYLPCSIISRRPFLMSSSLPCRAVIFFSSTAQSKGTTQPQLPTEQSCNGVRKRQHGNSLSSQLLCAWKGLQGFCFGEHGLMSCLCLFLCKNHPM